MYFIVTFFWGILHYIQFKTLKFFISRKICMFAQTALRMNVIMHKIYPHNDVKNFLSP